MRILGALARMAVPMTMMMLLSAAQLSAAGMKDIKFVNKLIGDKKTWVPEATPITFDQGQVVNVTLVNELSDPHGFFINGMTDPILVPGKIAGGVTPEVSFSMKVTEKPGDYEFKCHMHPAHVGGAFKVK